MKIGCDSNSYFSTACGYTSDSVIHTKSHIQEENHKNKTINYCHVCKLFCANKEKFTEHRFSNAHKRAMAGLEKPFEEPEVEEFEPGRRQNVLPIL